jgi:parallel beta-helix repeat protein
MDRLKKLTDATYSPTIAASEEAIRTQIDDSIQEVLDLALEDVTTNRKLSATGDFTGTINGGDVTLTEPGLSGAFNAHLADMAKVFINVMAPPLVPMAAAVGDGTDDIGAINGCISYAHTQYDGGVVIMPIPSLYYKVSSKIIMYSNILLIGATGGKAYIYNDTATAEPVIEIVGTAENRLKNVGIKNLKIRNGTASAGAYTSGKDGIEVKYCDGFEMRGCEVTEIQGAFGLSTRYSTDIWIKDGCKFYRCTYAHMYVLPECENIYVEGNIFDTCTSLTAANTYLFATGGETLLEGEYFCKNVWIKNNKFLNNPRWEGIDTHGGENIWIDNNYIENVKIGIMCGLVTGYVANPVLKDVWVQNNKVIQGTGDNDQAGVLVNGSDDGTIPADHVTVKGNSVKGFGGTASATNTGAITVYNVKDVTIDDNKIVDYSQYGISLYYNVRGCKVINNQIYNARGGIAGAESIISAIVLRSAGLYDIFIDGTEVGADQHDKAPKYFLRKANTAVSVQIGNNTIKDVQTALYSGVFEFSAQPTYPTNDITQKYGDVILNNNGAPGWYVSAPKIGFGSINTSIIVTVNIDSGSNIATIAANSTGDYKWLPEGMNIKIAGAGEAGADLNARILKNNVTFLVLDVNASTTVAGANLTYQGLTFEVA